jgi:hypothetical protein
MARLCLDELRKADGKPITAPAIAAAVIGLKGLPKNDPVLAASLNERVLTYLRELRKRGAVIKTGATTDAKWALPGPQ